MRWIFLLCAAASFIGAWNSSSAGWLGLFLLLGFACACASMLGFAARRVGSVAQGQSHREITMLLNHHPKKPPSQPAGNPSAPPDRSRHAP